LGTLQAPALAAHPARHYTEPTVIAGQAFEQ
jgi:hypothetical protein